MEDRVRDFCMLVLLILPVKKPGDLQANLVSPCDVDGHEHERPDDHADDSGVHDDHDDDAGAAADYDVVDDDD